MEGSGLESSSQQRMCNRLHVLAGSTFVKERIAPRASRAATLTWEILASSVAASAPATMRHALQAPVKTGWAAECPTPHACSLLSCLHQLLLAHIKTMKLQMYHMRPLRRITTGMLQMMSTRSQPHLATRPPARALR